MVQTVAIQGASNNPDRYSYMAFKLLQEMGHRIIPVSPKMAFLENSPVISDLNKINERVHTLTMYIGPDRSTVLQDQILKLKPGRVIFNPGSENPTLQKLLLAAGIPVLEACTLVLLRNGKF